MARRFGAGWYGMALLMILCREQAPGQGKPDPVCVAAQKASIPSHDLPPARVGAAMACQDPMDMYYHARTPAQMDRVRGCAYVQRGSIKPDDKGSDDMDVMSASAALAMIYAQGIGVAPNLPLAERFACEIQGGWDDGSEIANKLEVERAQGASRFLLDICKTPPGRQLNYACIVLEQNRLAASTPVEEKRFVAGTTAAQRAAFSRLQQARAAFLEAHGAEQPDGTVGIVQTVLAEDNDDGQSWVQALRDFRTGKLPTFSPGEFRAADQKLNAAYLEARQMAKQGCAVSRSACTPPEDIQKAERAWLKYREAWVAYGALRWPRVSPEAWRTWLTLDRTEMLGNVG